MDASMIHVEHLTKYFGPVLAVNDVTFQVEKNEVVGLLGNNGAGKTTIMRILTTYLPASSGIARVAGHDVFDSSLDVRRNIGYLPESIPLYPEMRVEEYLQYRAKLRQVDRKRRAARIAYCLERCHVTDVARRRMETLSKGYRQRVGLADAMLHDPPLLILDEPTDGLDPGQKMDTLNMLHELSTDHTIMLSSHLLTEVERIVKRVLILRRGHLALARKLSDIEPDPSIILEVRAPADQLTNLLRNLDGVATVSAEPMSDGLTSCEVKTHQHKDLREAIAQRVSQHGWNLRRLDLRRRTLQDRWNEINNWDDAQPAPPAPSLAAVPPSVTDVTTGSPAAASAAPTAQP
jgi:ABC-2 type transport system ATP-binding protein